MKRRNSQSTLAEKIALLPTKKKISRTAEQLTRPTDERLHWISRSLGNVTLRSVETGIADPAQVYELRHIRPYAQGELPAHLYVFDEKGVIRGVVHSQLAGVDPREVEKAMRFQVEQGLTVAVAEDYKDLTAVLRSGQEDPAILWSDNGSVIKYSQKGKEDEVNIHRLWAPETDHAVVQSWSSRINELLGGKEIINAGDVMINRWVNARLSNHPFDVDSIPKEDTFGGLPFPKDESLSRYILDELGDLRPEASASWSCPLRKPTDVYHLSLRWTDSENTNYKLSQEFIWGDEYGYLFESRTHVADMLKSSPVGRGAISERQIAPEDYPIIEMLIGILEEEVQEGRARFNG